MTMKIIRFTCLVCLAYLACSCLSRGPALEVRYFEPASSLQSKSSQGQTMLVNLEEVRARSYLDLPMVWRVSETEIRLDESNRWASAPSELGDDRLRTALFLAGPFAPLGSGFPRLTVSVEAFEGVFLEEPKARVIITASLAISSGQLFVFHHAEESPLASLAPEELARGIGFALDQSGTALSDWLGGILIGQ